MTIHLKKTPEELTALLKDLWKKPIAYCGGRNQSCPFSFLAAITEGGLPRQHCVLPICEPNRLGAFPRKTHKTSYRGKRLKKLYPLLGVYHAIFRRKKTK